MTITIDVPQEEEARLEAEAAKDGQSTEQYIRESFHTWLCLVASEPDTEETLLRDMQALSYSSFREVWDNEEDAVYDTLR